MENNKQFCAFIDILGFKNKIKKFEEGVEYYKQFFDAYECFTEIHNGISNSVSDVLKERGPLVNNLIGPVGRMIFSDSIVLYSSDWKALLFHIADVMSFLLSSGFLFRGGVGYGKHYSDIQPGQMYIVSEGLVQAVEIESKISNYPRIVISQPALKEIVMQMDSLYDLNNIFIQGEDDYWFVNPFFLNPYISSIYEQIMEDIDKYRNEQFVEKYIWMKRLCEYFDLQNNIRHDPLKYYLDSTIGQHFFYPKTFYTQSFRDINYSLSKTIYKQDYNDNIRQIIHQAGMYIATQE